MATIIYTLLAVLIGLVILAHSMFAFGNRYWSRNYQRSWQFWRYSKIKTPYGTLWGFWFDTHAVAFHWERYRFSFRYELFRFHFWSPFRKYTWTHWPLMFKLQSFCKPSSGWLGAKWRILFGPFDFMVARPTNGYINRY